MEIRIGMMNTGRELSFETSEAREDISAKVASALETKSASLSFTDVKGSTYVVPASALAYVEIGSDETRRVGFVA
ncbi:DUF3107 domain-containing protein [Microbacterium amylolyticum]|uniref:DUF3107 domain-containing protein n=1 Tax=Microbacterium amylolyticum TaxID=936337 RepID=A0ABS4ZLE0_9MICO|nr:DUF3107 domain-containing protein [Microbacterium amylolyticum]MBP2437775.1 hypothetical protein [Microbacterium amylolyticum]